MSNTLSCPAPGKPIRVRTSAVSDWLGQWPPEPHLNQNPSENSNPSIHQQYQRPRTNVAIVARPFNPSIVLPFSHTDAILDLSCFACSLLQNSSTSHFVVRHPSENCSYTPLEDYRSTQPIVLTRQQLLQKLYVTDSHHGSNQIPRPQYPRSSKTC